MSFVVKPDVHQNVAELLRHLGSATRPLSLLDLARLLNAQDGRQRGASTVQRWRDGAEPDLASIELMAALAGVSFEEFALGTKQGRQAPASTFKQASAAEEKRKAERARKRRA